MSNANSFPLIVTIFMFTKDFLARFQREWKKEASEENFQLNFSPNM